jgi:hypothetical protein
MSDARFSDLSVEQQSAVNGLVHALYTAWDSANGDAVIEQASDLIRLYLRVNALRFSSSGEPDAGPALPVSLLARVPSAGRSAPEAPERPCP